jgi:hypothetical protein
MPRPTKEVTTMSENDAVAYRSKIHLQRIRGPYRIAHLPIDGPVNFGVHSEVAEHYGVSPDISEPHATTLDYIVAATSG